VTSFAGISRIVGMPPTSPAGAGVPGLIPASATRTAPGTLFATPVPSGAQIHAGITGGCSACHDTNMVWMGVSAYPISPSVMTAGAQYRGFQTRPTATGSTYAVADANHPSSGDCSTCHAGTTFFDGAVKPAGHIPTNNACSTCHGANFTVAALKDNAALHTGITAGCASCHAAGPFAGRGTARGGSTLCTTAALPYQPMPKPLSACGASPDVPNAATHIPVGTVACERCHSASNFTTFSGTVMKPTSLTANIAMHTAVNLQTCMSCHEQGYRWKGFGTNKTTRPTDHAQSTTRRAPNDCDNSGCHRVEQKFQGMRLLPRPVMRAAVNSALPRMLPRLQGVQGDATAAGSARFDHRGVSIGQCQTCHNGQLARAQPPRHFGGRLSCDACHRSTAWAPAQYTHPANVAGQCAACHNGVDATARPSQHFVTVRACDSCHRGAGWQPVRYQHLSPAFQPQPDRPTCVSCHITNLEMIPRQMHGNPRVRPVPVPSKPGP
jgi:hypothetical protein